MANLKRKCSKCATSNMPRLVNTHTRLTIAKRAHACTCLRVVFMCVTCARHVFVPVPVHAIQDKCARSHVRQCSHVCTSGMALWSTAINIVRTDVALPNPTGMDLRRHAGIHFPISRSSALPMNTSLNRRDCGPHDLSPGFGNSSMLFFALVRLSWGAPYWPVTHHSRPSISHTRNKIHLQEKRDHHAAIGKITQISIFMKKQPWIPRAEARGGKGYLC